MRLTECSLVSCQRLGELAGQQTGRCCLWPSVCKTACLLRALIPADGAHVHAPSAQNPTEHALYSAAILVARQARLTRVAASFKQGGLGGGTKKTHPGPPHTRVISPCRPSPLPHSILARLLSFICTSDLSFFPTTPPRLLSQMWRCSCLIRSPSSCT